MTEIFFRQTNESRTAQSQTLPGARRYAGAIAPMALAMAGLCGAAMPAQAATDGDFVISSEVVAAGGVAMTGSGYELVGTTGQAVMGNSGNGTDGLWSGFWADPPPVDIPVVIEQPTTDIQLPSGGGTVTPSTGQTVVVTDNGSNGSTIALPTPPSNGSATLTVTLPGTGSVNVSNNSAGTQLQVQSFTLPGSTTQVSTVQVSNGSATLVASGAGQTLVTTGISNGLTVTSGGSGTSATVTASGNSQSIALTGTANLTLGSTLDTQRTSVTLTQGSNGSNSQANLQIGGQTLSVRTDGGTTQMQVVPTTTANGQSTNAIVVTAGSASITGQSGQVMNVVPANSASCATGTSGGYFEARSSNAQSDILSVNQGNLALSGHIPSGVVAYHYSSAACNGFTSDSPLAASTKEVLIYQGEYVEVDKNGQLVKIVVRSKDGKGAAAGDPLNVGAATAAIAGLSVDTAIPRLDATTSRLPAGLTISKRIEQMLQQYGADWTFSSQDALGTIRISDKQGNKVALLPVGEVLADAERQEGVQCVNNGLCQSAAGNISTTFNAALDAPQDFINSLRQFDSAATLRLNRDGNLLAHLLDRTYAAQPDWNVLPANGGNGFSANGFTADNALLWFATATSRQALYPVLANLARLQTVLKKFDAAATAIGNHQGGVSIVLNGQSYLLRPSWEVLATPASHAADDYWVDNGIIYINNLDGTAQGMLVK